MLINRIKGLSSILCFGLQKPERKLYEDFFDANNPRDVGNTNVEEKIKVGEKEYSQAELQRIVGLGEIGLEAETKYKTRIDRVWPQFQSIVNEKKEMSEKLAKFESDRQQAEKELERSQNPQQQSQQPNQQQQYQPQFTEQQIREAALKQAEELGIGPKAQYELAKKAAMEVMQGQQLISDVSTVIDNMTADGLPTATVEDVLNHMQTEGFRNPEKAYKDMFEKEYYAKQMEKTSQLQRGGIPSTQPSNAGAKVPPPVKATKDNLDQLVAEALQGAFQ